MHRFHELMLYIRLFFVIGASLSIPSTAVARPPDCVDFPCDPYYGYCGDAACDFNEDCSTCANDCGSCPSAFCGDSLCQPGESCSNCSMDCGNCPTPVYCGDNLCQSEESCFSCSVDCGGCPEPDPGVQQGYWQCHKGPWAAYTNTRRMEGQTSFECGIGICDDSGHSYPTSWVDIAGGISQSVEDISDTFFGPLNGEWNGCTNNVQVSTGMRWIEGINQGWERWPQQWGSGQYFTDDISFITGSSGAMNFPFASVYDLDCWPGWLSWLWGGSCPKDVIGTIYWENFPVTAHLAGGNPVVSYNYGTPYGWARWYLLGDTGVACSSPDNGCESVVCSDLHVFSTLDCTWQVYDPCANIPPDMMPPPECRLGTPQF